MSVVGFPLLLKGFSLRNVRLSLLIDYQTVLSLSFYIVQVLIIRPFITNYMGSLTFLMELHKK